MMPSRTSLIDNDGKNPFTTIVGNFFRYFS
jgi:hypothetical protein